MSMSLRLRTPLVHLGALGAAACIGCEEPPLDRPSPPLLMDSGTTRDAYVPPGTDAGVAAPDAVTGHADVWAPPGLDASASDAASGPTAPGGACACDAECASVEGHEGVCVRGVCMTIASAGCSAAGSATECPSGARCWGLEGFEGGLCWPDCDAVASCAGVCDGDGSCAPAADATCDASCSRVCAPSEDCPLHAHAVDGGCACDDGYVVNDAGDGCVAACMAAIECEAGEVCTAGRCVPDVSGGPTGAPPTGCVIGMSDIPDWRCTGTAAHCGELVAFEPVRGPGYWNYPLNGETTTNQYRSFVRRDVMMLVKYAAAMVACQARGWPGNGGELGLGDMSERDGAIPGTSIGSPGHPAGTHVNGHDMDIAYFQVGTADNTLRPICPHTSGGSDAYHCTGEPSSLDVWRSALFIAHLHATPRLRVIGVDGRAGPSLDAAIDTLCAGGWVSGMACTAPRMTYETTDSGRGWYYFHHHHLHISVSAP
jgi:hypothetical protein